MSTYDKLRQKYEKAKSEFEYDGNFTIAIVTYRGKRGVGAAKRNPRTDRYDPDIGATVAHARALRNLDEKFQTLRLVSAVKDRVFGQ